MAVYDLANASYDNKSFDTTAQAVANPGLQEVAFSTDGTKMYIVVDGQPFTANPNATYQYALSTAWDVTTAVYEKSGPVGDVEPEGVAFKPDGTRMYVVGADNDRVTQYTLTTAWDIGTAGSAVIFSVFSPSTHPSGLAFSTDGTKMYVADLISDAVFQYNLSTAWDVSTAAYASVSADVSGQATNPSSVAFNDDGTKMFVIDLDSDVVYQYNLTTAWSVATASYSGVSFSVSGQAGFPEGLTFSTDGTKMYVAASGSHTVFQYTVGLVFDGILTVGYLRMDAGTYTPPPPPAVPRHLEDGTTVRHLEDGVTERTLESV